MPYPFENYFPHGIFFSLKFKLSKNHGIFLLFERNVFKRPKMNLVIKIR